MNPPRPTGNPPGDGERRHPGWHAHPHAHEDGRLHAHPHHHEPGDVPGHPLRGRVHDHAHARSFERFTYIVSPIHNLDPRAKIVASFVLIIAVVLAPPVRPLELSFLVMLLMAVTLLANLPLRGILLRSTLVLPVAAGIALFAPLATMGGSWSVSAFGAAYRSGWITVWGIVSKAWLSAYLTLLLASTTPPPSLFQALRALKMPLVFLTMLSFLYRYTDVLGRQLRSLRYAVVSRAHSVKGRRLAALYGNLAGNLFIRAYERGERVHAAMLSRGYDGTLPTAARLQAGAADWLLVSTAVLAAIAVVLY